MKQEITVNELGNQLPVPLTGGIRPFFNFKAWRMPEEKALNDLKTKHKGIGKYVRSALDYMLKDWDGKAWAEHDHNSRTLLLNRMPLANVFYLWIQLRIDALGSKMIMQNMACPHCQTEIKKFEADLTTMVVQPVGIKLDENGGLVSEKVAEHFCYELKKPFDIGEVKVTKLFFSFTPWDCMEKLGTNATNLGAVKEAVLTSSFIGAGIEGSDKMVPLDKNKIFENLSKKDIEGYYDAVDTQNGGPVMKLTYGCPSCEKEVEQPLNWTYDYFFGSSSP